MPQRIEKAPPKQQKWIYLNHCGISPLHESALEAESAFSKTHSKDGILVFREYPNLLGDLHLTAAKLLKTKQDNISFITNTASGLNMIANGYPFSPGDEIITYSHEYPSNYHPWALQQARGVRVINLPDSDPGEQNPSVGPRGWSMEDLERLTSNNTKVIALSHVQFTSGFAADLEALAAFSKDRKIDLIIDAAQSLGSLPFYPESLGIAAAASSGWKWLRGPIGSGVLYTSPALREKLSLSLVGPGSMEQGDDFLDLRWNPVSDGRMFEFSTLPCAAAVALEAAMRHFACRCSMEEARESIYRLQDLVLSKIDGSKFRPMLFPLPHRSGILSFVTSKDPRILMKSAAARGVVCSSRGGYFRIAPHYYNTEEEIDRAVEILNSL